MRAPGSPWGRGDQLHGNLVLLRRVHAADETYDRHRPETAYVAAWLATKRPEGDGPDALPARSRCAGVGHQESGGNRRDRAAECRNRTASRRRHRPKNSAGLDDLGESADGRRGAPPTVVDLVPSISDLRRDRRFRFRASGRLLAAPATASSSRSRASAPAGNEAPCRSGSTPLMLVLKDSSLALTAAARSKPALSNQSSQWHGSLDP